MPLHFNPAHFDPAEFLALPTVSTAFGRQLAMVGYPIEVLQPVVTGYDYFGNPIIGYEHLCYAYTVFRIQGADERFLIPGTTEQADAISFFEANVELTQGCKVATAHHGNWRVLYVDQKLKGGKVHHKEVFLRRLGIES